MIRLAGAGGGGGTMGAVRAEAQRLDVTAGLIRSAALVQDILSAASGAHRLTPRNGRRANEPFRRAMGERIDELIETLTRRERDSLAAVLSKVVLDNEAPETWPEE